MPHQCVKCGTFYPDKSDEIIKGCGKCHGKLFFYVRNGREELLAQQRRRSLHEQERLHIENDVRTLIGESKDMNSPVVLDLESIRIEQQGTYELDIVSLFQKEAPVIYKLDEGKYMVDLSATFAKLAKGR